MASPARNIIGLAIITSVMVLVLVGLGAWQLQRLGFKTELLRNIDARLAAASVQLPDERQWSDTNLDIDYLKVTVSGSFQHEREAYLFGVIDKNNRGENIPGYFVLTPLQLENGATLIVNRGFVPQDKKDPATRSAGQTQGPVTVSGLLRVPERQGVFTPAADQTKRVLYARDPALIAQWFDLKRVAPFSIDADKAPNDGGLPSGGHTIVSVANNHLQYAITWFSLALITIAMFAVYAVKRRSDRPD